MINPDVTLPPNERDLANALSNPNELRRLSEFRLENKAEAFRTALNSLVRAANNLKAELAEYEKRPDDQISYDLLVAAIEEVREYAYEVADATSSRLVNQGMLFISPKTCNNLMDILAGTTAEDHHDKKTNVEFIRIIVSIISDKFNSAS